MRDAALPELNVPALGLKKMGLSEDWTASPFPSFIEHYDKINFCLPLGKIFNAVFDIAMVHDEISFMKIGAVFTCGHFYMAFEKC